MSLKNKNLSLSALKKILCLSLSVIVTSVCTFSVFADQTLDDLRNEYDRIEQEIAENEDALNQVEQDIEKKEGEIADIREELDGINQQIEILDERIEVLNGDISTLQVSIDDVEVEIGEVSTMITGINARMDDTELRINNTREQLLGRIRESYMTGEASNIEILFSSSDMSSFLARKELVARVSENDTQLINDLSAELVELNELETELVTQQTTLEEKQTELNTQMDTLTARENDLVDTRQTQQDKKSDANEKYEQIQDKLDQLDKDSEEYKAEIARQKAEREKIDAQIDAYIKEHGSSEGDTPDAEFNNDGNMAWPLKKKSYITAGYPAYSNGDAHWGIDIVCSDGNTNGTPFYAVQGGEVIIASGDGSWNYGFGNYCVIDHGDGTQSLYGHASSIDVRVGQIVQKGQKIGNIGSTGNSTGPHLHLEIRVKKADGSVSRENPLKYVKNPY